MLNFVSTILRDLADKLDTGNSKLSAEDTVKIVHILDILENGDTAMSKTESYSYLGVSRATFDNLVSSGYLPVGRQLHEGVKSLFWYKSDLEMYKIQNNK